MKTVLLLLALVMSTTAAVRAQYDGNVFVINNTDCNVAICVYAKCPDCTDYSVFAMMSVPGGGGFPGMLLYDASLPTPNPYF